MSETVSDVGGVPASNSVNTTPEAQAAADYRAMMHKVKLDGKELDVPYQELVESYQLKSSSHKKFQEAADAKRQVTEFLSRAKEDPWSLLQQLGLDPDELATKRAADRLEWEMMPEDKRRLIEKERDVTKREKELKKFEDEREQQRQQQLAHQVEQELDLEIGEVLKTKGLKPTPKVVARIAEVMIAALESGQTIPAAKALERVDADVFDEAFHYLEQLPSEVLLSRLPKELLKKIRKAEMSQVQTGKPFGMSTSEQAPSQSRAKKVKSTDSFFERLDKKFS